MRTVPLLLVAVVIALAPLASRADNLAGAERLVCTSVQVTVCTDQGACVVDLPWNVNVPQFIEVDLAARRLSTTKASGHERSTPIESLKRGNGMIVIQGFELGRAFSFVVDEASGTLTAAVARQGLAVTVFGACTPKN